MQHGRGGTPPAARGRRPASAARRQWWPGTMPKTKARCYKTVSGIPIPPADGLLCLNCRFLLEHGQTGHKQAWLAYACDPDKKVMDAEQDTHATPPFSSTHHHALGLKITNTTMGGGIDHKSVGFSYGWG